VREQYYKFVCIFVALVYGVFDNIASVIKTFNVNQGLK